MPSSTTDHSSIGSDRTTYDVSYKSKRSNLANFCKLLGYSSTNERTSLQNSKFQTQQHAEYQHQLNGAAAEPISAVTMPTNPLLHKSTLAKYLYKDDQDIILGGAVCSLPSLDFFSSEEEGIDNPITSNEKDLSQPTSSFNQKDTTGTIGNIKEKSDNPLSSKNREPEVDLKLSLCGRLPSPSIPAMTASVLESLSDKDQRILFRKNSDISSPSSYFPQSSCKNTDQLQSTSTTSAESEHMEQIAAENLGQRTCWTRSSIPQIPFALARSLATSFSSIIDSRVKAWTLLLLRNSLSSGDEKSRSRLLTMLATRNSINMSSLWTQFKVDEHKVKSNSEKSNENISSKSGKMSNDKSKIGIVDNEQ